MHRVVCACLFPAYGRMARLS